MANSLELHFSRIDATPAKTVVNARVYSMLDLGLDADGNRQWNRTLLRSITANLDAGIPRAQIVSEFKARLAAVNTELALGFSTANQLCTL
jgi:hypothetical protein